MFSPYSRFIVIFVSIFQNINPCQSIFSFNPVLYISLLTLLQIFACSAITNPNSVNTSPVPVGLTCFIGRGHRDATGGGRGFSFWFSCALLIGPLQSTWSLSAVPNDQQQAAASHGRSPQYTASWMALCGRQSTFL